MKMFHEEDEESLSGSDSDNTGFEEDMEALRKACSVTGLDNNDLPKSFTAAINGDSDEEEDIQLLRSIQQRFSLPTNHNDNDNHDDIGDGQEYQPLNTILPSSDDYGDDDDDFATLRAIQQRFSQYNDSMNNNCMESSLQRSEQVGATNNIDLGIESSPNPNFFLERLNNGQGFPDCVDGRAPNQNFDISNITRDPYANISEGHGPGSELVSVTDGSFPRSAQAFVEAINKNRKCQKFIRNKLIQIETKMEENKKLRERVKILKDFEVACRTRTSRALSQKKDARIQLISIPKQRANASKIKDKSTHPIYQGPTENLQVAHYRDAVSRYPFSLSREPWSKEETENLLKGIKQQFQEMLMQRHFSGEDADSSDLDSMIEKIRDHEITPEEIRSFLPKVNWEHLASMYLKGRSGPECQSRWMNCDDLVINHGPWTLNEDKMLLHIVSKGGMGNWIEIAKELETNRTPFQCLSRFQRSLNASIIKNEWTPREDKELRNAVAEYGESNWQVVASTLEGRTGTQCSNRWKKSLNPLRVRVGKWDQDEDKRLKISVRLFGAKNWNKIAKFVSGRTQVQCRERWVNCLDPSLNMNEWTEEEDLKLKAAIEEHGYCWSRIAACIPPRTDSQCRRRWKVLLPHQVSKLQVARKMKKAVFISNFVDREGERPDLTVKDLITPLLIELDPEANEDHIGSNDKKRRTDLKVRSRRTRKVNHTKEVFKLIDDDDIAENDRPGDITNDREEPVVFDGGNFEIEKNATGKLKGKERTVTKIRSRRARQVTHTEKLGSINEDDLEDNDGHVDSMTNYNSKNKPHKLTNKASTSSQDTGFLDQNIGEICEVEKKATGKRKRKQRTVFKTKPRRARKVTHTEKASILLKDDVENNDGHADITSNGVAATAIDGDNSEIKKNTTRKRKRKQRGNKEHEEMEETWEPDSISMKTTFCSRVDGDCRAILTDETNLIDPISMSRSSDDTLMNEHCSSHDGPQVKTPKILKVYSRRSKRNHNENDPKISCINSGVRRSGCYGEIDVQLEDEETIGSFLRKLKKRRIEIP